MPKRTNTYQKLITLFISITANTNEQTMEPQIAIATVSGKAYYLLVSELKRRNLAFLSLIPNDTIPVNVKVVITTMEERSLIKHGEVLEYEENRSPAAIIDEAIRIIKGKRSYDKLIIGIDPGENIFGVAALGDGEIVETKNCYSIDETLNTIEHVLSHTPTSNAIIRIGNGAPSYAEDLLRRLNDALPENVTIESVEEEGTSKSLGETSHRRGKRDVSSATKIAQRHGHTLPRRKR